MAKQAHPDLECAETVENDCLDADVVLHLTEWKQFREIDRPSLRRWWRPHDHRRPQSARPHSVACSGLDLPRPRQAFGQASFSSFAVSSRSAGRSLGYGPKCPHSDDPAHERQRHKSQDDALPERRVP